MKCWCFNEEQLEAALAEWVNHERFMTDDNAPDAVVVGETRIRKCIREFLSSPEARKHKLGLHGMWDRQGPAPVVATPTGTLDPKHDTEGRN